MKKFKKEIFASFLKAILNLSALRNDNFVSSENISGHTEGFSYTKEEPRFCAVGLQPLTRRSTVVRLYSSAPS